MRRRRLLKTLDTSIADERRVRIRRGSGWELLDGYVQARSAKWVLMAVEYDAGFDGHAAVRLDDISGVEWQRSGEGFARRALAAEGHWPLPVPPGVDLTSTRSVVRTLAGVAPLITIHYERKDPDKCLIGVVRDPRPKSFVLQTITPDAEWDDDSVFRHRSVSRFDVGRAYERRLDLVAGPAPAWPVETR